MVKSRRQLLKFWNKWTKFDSCWDMLIISTNDHRCKASQMCCDWTKLPNDTTAWINIYLQQLHLICCTTCKMLQNDVRYLRGTKLWLLMHLVCRYWRRNSKPCLWVAKLPKSTNPSVTKSCCLCSTRQRTSFLFPQMLA